MEFRVEYFQGEERDGYYVQPMKKRMWAVQLDILKEIDIICKRHGIKYYGWYGTLLGAVRHHGFIPWDDDMDLAMLRENWERFLFFCRTELPEGWTISKSGPTLISVSNTDVMRLDQEFLDRYHGCPMKISVDIFCLDRIPQGKEKEELWLNLFWAVGNLYRHWDLFEDDEQWQKGKWVQKREIENLTGYHFDERSPMKEQLYFLANRIAAMYWDVAFDEVADVTRLYEHREQRIPRACFDRVIEVPFEDTTMPILEDYELILRLSYGEDYMTPVRENVHDGFKKQIDILRNLFRENGEALPECFDVTFESFE